MRKSRSEMQKRIVQFEVTYSVEIEIDDTSEIVREYESDQDMFMHISQYNFSPVLPVIEKAGVKIISNDVIEIN